jgi:hypothetical protein
MPHPVETLTDTVTLDWFFWEWIKLSRWFQFGYEKFRENLKHDARMNELMEKVEQGRPKHANIIMGQLMITKHDDIFTGVSLTDGVPGWKFSAVISRRSLHGGVADTRGSVQTKGNLRLVSLSHVLIHLLSS